MLLLLTITVYFKVLGIALNFVGSLILIFGTMKTDKQIDTEATIGLPVLKSTKIKKFLLRSRTISAIGLVIISVGFLAQLVSVFLEISI